VRAFSLIELLVVVAIIALLAVLTPPALNAILSGRNPGEAATQIAGAVEAARARATSGNSHVWLCFQPDSRLGQNGLWVATLTSTSPAPDGAAPIGKPIFLPGVALVAPGELDVGIPLTNAVSLDSYSGGLAISFGGRQYDGRSITFTPGGEAMLAARPDARTGFDPQILIGLKAVRGETRVDGSAAAVLIDGSAPVAIIFRKASGEA